MKSSAGNRENSLGDSEKENLVERIRKTSKFFKLISCKKRLLIIFSLVEKPMSVTEIQKLINLSQPSASNHLKILYNTGMVSHSKKGRTVYYKANRVKFSALVECLKNCNLS